MSFSSRRPNKVRGRPVRGGLKRSSFLAVSYRGVSLVFEVPGGSYHLDEGYHTTKLMATSRDTRLSPNACPRPGAARMYSADTQRPSHCNTVTYHIAYRRLRLAGITQLRTHHLLRHSYISWGSAMLPRNRLASKFQWRTSDMCIYSARLCIFD